MLSKGLLNIFAAVCLHNLFLKYKKNFRNLNGLVKPTILHKLFVDTIAMLWQIQKNKTRKKKNFIQFKKIICTKKKLYQLWNHCFFTEWTFSLACLYLTKISLHYGTERLLKKVICIHQNYVIQHCIVSIVEILWTKNYLNFFPKFFIAQSAEQAKCNLKWWDTAMRKCLPFSLAERRKGLFTFWYCFGFIISTVWLLFFLQNVWLSWSFIIAKNHLISILINTIPMFSQWWVCLHSGNLC